MSLLFCDSFDDRDIDHIGDRYSSSTLNSGSGAGITTSGRTGKGLTISTGILDVFDHITWQSNSTHQNLYVGVAQQASLSTALVSIRYNGTPHIYAQLNSDLTISMVNFAGGGNTVLATTSGTVPATGFFYIELYGKIDPTVGAYELRIDGQRWLSATGVNTSSDGSSVANEVRIIYNHIGIDGATTVIDDFYIADDDADGGNALVTGFAGPVKIACLEETANGDLAQWTPLSGSNYQNVDETSGEDGDTSYNASAADGAKDLYVLDGISINNITIKGVHVRHWARKEDALYRAIIPIARVSGTDYEGDTLVLGGSYGALSTFWERNPATGAAWTRAEINALQVGAEVSTAP